MGKTFFIGKYFGIPLKLHWSFFLLIPFVYYYGNKGAGSWEGIFFLGALLSLVFLCITLHEYGHVLMARRYKINTLDVILSPIGGVARLEQMPSKPMQEFWIALAGPFVNLLIAIGICISLAIAHPNAIHALFSTGSLTAMAIELESSEYTAFYVGASSLLLINLMLIGFNMLPAFPMDGGRVFRALLSLKMGRLRATRIASIVGRVIAVAFMLLSMWNGNLSLGLVGLFIYITAEREYKSVVFAELMQVHTAEKIMNKNYTIFDAHSTMAQAHEAMKKNDEKHFLVVDEEGRFAGALYGALIEDAAKKDALQENIWGNVVPDFNVATPQHNLSQIYETMLGTGYPLTAIFEQEQLVGVVAVEDIQKFLGSKEKTSSWQSFFQKKG